MRIPDWWEFVLLSLATYRTVRLIGWDVITRPIRVRVTHRSEIEGTVYVNPRTGEVGGGYRRGVDEFLHCPFCLGFWVSVAWWAAWYAWPRATLGVAAPLAIAAIVELVGRNLDS